MWDLKYDTNELIYKTETDSQTQKTNLWLQKEKGGRGQINQEFGLTDTNYYTVYKIDKQEGPTVQHRELYSISYNKP